MKILLIIILIFCFLLMDAAFTECLKKPQKQLESGVWFGMFPSFLLVSVFGLINLLLPYERPFIVAGQNISILFFLFSSLLFGISIKFNKGSVST